MTLHKACTFFQYEEHVKEGASSILNSALPCNCNMPSSTNKLHSGIVLYILQLPQEWGKCSAMGTPQALSPCPERSPRSPVCEEMEPGRQQNLDQATVLHAAPNIQPSSPCVKRATAPFHICSTSPVLSLSQLIYLGLMAEHQNLAQRQLQDGK